MKGIDSTGAPLVHVPGWMGGWMDGWMEVKAVLRIAYSNQKITSYFVQVLIIGVIEFSKIQIVNLARIMVSKFVPLF
jgi:hypothetical protein